MSGEKRFDHRTPEEVLADLEERRKDHKFLTTEEAVAWNARQVKTPLSSNHWSVKDRKIRHVIRMGGAWKKFAKVMYNDVLTIKDRFVSIQATLRELEQENTELRRMMVYCDKCSSAPGESCSFRCSRDGSRDTQ